MRQLRTFTRVGRLVLQDVLKLPDAGFVTPNDVGAAAALTGLAASTLHNFSLDTSDHDEVIGPVFDVFILNTS